MSALQPEALANYHCKCGENPLWDARRKVLFWIDIPAGSLFRYELASGRHACIHSGPEIGGFTLQADGQLLLFRGADIVALDPDSGRLEVKLRYSDPGMTRFNDVIADPEGRVYAGTIGSSRESGGLYLLEKDGRVRKLFGGTGCSNGMAFSPDLRRFYWTCSTRKRIFEFDYDHATGALEDERVLVDLSAEPGCPDGLTIDRSGNLWSARWDGSGLFKYTPRGEPSGEIRFPVAKVSSAIFGGPTLSDLYVTTAGGEPGSNGLEGTLYRVPEAGQGMTEFRSRILLA